MPENSAIIRPFRPEDKPDVRRIAHDTAFMGEPATQFCDAKEVISDALTAYGTDYEPESCFVAEINGKVAGYLIGTTSKSRSEKIIGQKIIPKLFWRALASGVFLKKKNLVFLYRMAVSILKQELKEPDLNEEYPATLHINLDPGFRGQNLGSRLISTFLDYLKKENVVGVHCATLSERAAKFFSQQGFQLLFSGQRSYYKHILHKNIPLYIYGKKI